MADLKPKRITVIGTGYVGLVAAACFASEGNDVTCVDIDQAKVTNLCKGILPIYEPGLEELVEASVSEGRLRFSVEHECCAQADVIFMAVGTPTVTGGGGSADLSYLIAAARDIAKHLSGFTIIVNKSTVPVGTAELVHRVIDAESESDFAVVSNPEFLREGSAVSDFMNPDRVVIGANHPDAASLLQALYAPFLDRSSGQLLSMEPRAAELTKYAANAYLACRLSFINDIASLCDAVGADIRDVQRGMGSDHRIGPSFLSPGVGYGGSCFPKDTRALLHTARQHGRVMHMIAAAEQVNERQKLLLVQQLLQVFDQDLVGRTFGVWGLSFKPNTDDVRESSALATIRELVQQGARVRAHDPVAGEEFMAHLGSCPAVTLVDDMYAAAQGAEALLIITEWGVYAQPDLEALRAVMKAPRVLDGRNMLDRTEVTKAGFEYTGVGR